MKHLKLTLLAIGIVITACGGTKSEEKEEAQSNVVSNGVAVEYASADALNAPAYDPEAEWGTPFALADGLTHSMNGFPHVELGAYPEGGKFVYQVLMVNQSTDTVAVQSIKLPDGYMTVDWSGSREYRPGILSGFKLVCDSAVMRDDYRFIITYKDNKYPPQTFHLDLRPDAYKLLEERESNNAE